MKVKKFPRGIEVLAGVVIKNKNGKILLTRSAKWSNKWVLPGGHIEPGETIVQAAARETKEETGLKTRSVGILQAGELINLPEFSRPAHFIFFIVLLVVVGGDVKLQKEELSEYQWLAPQDALKLNLASVFARTIKLYLKLIKKRKK